MDVKSASGILASNPCWFGLSVICHLCEVCVKLEKIVFERNPSWYSIVSPYRLYFEIRTKKLNEISLVSF